MNMYEALEDRRLLSGSVLNNGVLHVHGTPKADHIHVNLKADGLLHVVINGKVDKINPSDVTEIVLDGGDGDDLLELVNAHVVTNINGGRGNDKIRFHDNAKIDGGDGLDEVVSDAVSLASSILNSVEKVSLV